MNNKKGGAILKIILIIILLLAAIVIYLYYFHSFKTFRVCVSQTEVQNTTKFCETDKECLDSFLINNTFTESINTAPDFLVNKMREIFENAIYCDGTCKLRRIYPEDFMKQEIESCNPGDTEIIQKIRGKEGLKILKFIKDNPELTG